MHTNNYLFKKKTWIIGFEQATLRCLLKCGRGTLGKVGIVFFISLRMKNSLIYPRVICEILFRVKMYFCDYLKLFRFNLIWKALGGTLR